MYKKEGEKNMISIGKDNVRYSVNQEKRVVVAYIEGTQNMFLNFCDENAAPRSARTLWDKKVLYMPNHFSAKATCSENDKWDEELGKRIAFDRLKDKVIGSFLARMDAYEAIINKEMDFFFDRVNKYESRLINCSNFRKEKIKEVLEN